MDILIDYLVLSLHFCSLEDVKKKMNVHDVNFISIRSYYGLENCVYFGGIKFHYNLSNSMIILDMSGQGCRMLETLYPDIKWVSFISWFMEHEGSHIARLDIACDDKPELGKNGMLCLETMIDHFKKNKYISLSRRKIFTDGDEQSLIFGSPSSDRRLRIYNKALERKYYGHWIRVEFQLRDDSALSFFMRAWENNSIGQAFYGLLIGYLRFTTNVNQDDHNQNRLVTCVWWNKFCKFSSKIKGFYLGGLEYNLQSLNDFVTKQAASSLRTFVEINKGDLTSLIEMCQSAKLNKKQDFLIKTEALKSEILKTY
jgi:hypothetical protein